MCRYIHYVPTEKTHDASSYAFNSKNYQSLQKNAVGLLRLKLLGCDWMTLLISLLYDLNESSFLLWAAFIIKLDDYLKDFFVSYSII